jgi:hypothetical protein
MQVVVVSRVPFVLIEGLPRVFTASLSKAILSPQRAPCKTKITPDLKDVSPAERTPK